jgi:hypothetical protein
MRSHLLKAATDVNGNLLASSVVAVYQNGTGNTSQALITNPIYSDETSSNLLPNPYTTPDGNINFYLDGPQRVDLGITPPGASPYVIMDVDVLASGATPGSPLQLQAATPQAGYALVNGTGNIVTWTVPSDGQNHRVTFMGTLHVTTAQTGGAIQVTFAMPDGSITTQTMFAGAQGAGFHQMGTTYSVVVGPGQTITVAQSSAQTAGAAIAWVEIWGN